MNFLRLVAAVGLACQPVSVTAAVLQAGAAKVDITDERGLVNDRLYARALALRSGETTAVLVSIDAVAIGGIGRIKDDFLPRVRAELKKELGISPDRGNSADITGFASKTIEESLGKGSVALFVQGAGGDINPIDYKAVNHIRSAEPLGLMLGLSTLRAVRQIRCQPNAVLNVHSEKLELPRADLAPRIREMEAERGRLAESLKGTFLNLDEFLPLMMKYRLSTNSPSLSSYRYLHELKLERPDLSRLDAANRRHLQAYVRNVHTMEQITRLNTNLRLLKMHQKTGHAAGNRTVSVELSGLRVGDFVLTTFPGELTVPVGLNIKRAAKHPQAFVAGYTNGYVHYAPTAEQLKNIGGAQEDSDCMLAPEWQRLYETRAVQMIRRLLR